MGLYSNKAGLNIIKSTGSVSVSKLYVEDVDLIKPGKYGIKCRELPKELRNSDRVHLSVSGNALVLWASGKYIMCVDNELLALKKLAKLTKSIDLTMWLFNEEQSKHLETVFRECDIVRVWWGFASFSSMYKMFYNCYRLKQFTPDLCVGIDTGEPGYVDTSDVRDIRWAFALDEKVEKTDIRLDFSYKNLDNVEYMDNMCENRSTAVIDLGLNDLRSLKSAKDMIKGVNGVNLRCTDKCYNKLKSCGAFDGIENKIDWSTVDEDEAVSSHSVKVIQDREHVLLSGIKSGFNDTVCNFKVEVGKSRSFIYDKLESGCELLSMVESYNMAVGEECGDTYIVYTTAQRVAHPLLTVKLRDDGVLNELSNLNGVIDISKFNLSTNMLENNEMDTVKLVCKQLILPKCSVEDVNCIDYSQVGSVNLGAVDVNNITSLGSAFCRRGDSSTINIGKYDLSNLKSIHKSFIRVLNSQGGLVDFGNHDLGALDCCVANTSMLSSEVSIKCNKLAYEKLRKLFTGECTFIVGSEQLTYKKYIRDLYNDPDHVVIDLFNTDENFSKLRRFSVVTEMSNEEIDNTVNKAKLLLGGIEVDVRPRINDKAIKQFNKAVGLIVDNELIIYTTAKWLNSPLSSGYETGSGFFNALKLLRIELDFSKCDFEFGYYRQAYVEDIWDYVDCEVTKIVMPVGTDFDKFFKLSDSVEVEYR